MSVYAEEAKIVDESTRIRLKELEVEKTRILVDKDNYPHKVTIRIWAIVCLSIAGIVLGISGFSYKSNVVSAVEDTKQAVEDTKQKKAQVEINRIQADSQRDLAQLHVEKFRQIVEIVRNSKSDELAIKSLAEVQ